MRPTSFYEALEVLVAIRNQQVAGAEEVPFLKHCLRYAADSHAQFLQDMWVTYELPGLRGGFFVEFGAADGVKSSNSCYLERQLGWKGILAEPARIWRERLHAARTCFIDDRCVWTTSGERLVFNEAEIALHSTIDAFSDSDAHAYTRKTGERYEVETVSLNDLLAHWNAPQRIDYLSLDTEGSELAILQGFDFHRYDVRLISVEHNHTDKRQPIFDLLTAQGFRRKFEQLSNVDDWYVKA
ncbi:MAG: FkbM family methyltransferase [Phenylobacterium sp.]